MPDADPAVIVARDRDGVAWVPAADLGEALERIAELEAMVTELRMWLDAALLSAADAPPPRQDRAGEAIRPAPGPG